METNVARILEINTAPSDSIASPEILNGSSPFPPKMLVSEETLDDSSPSSLSESPCDHSLAPAPDQNRSSPNLGKKAQDDPSLVLSPRIPSGTSTMLTPINETLDGSSPANELDALDGSSSMPMQAEITNDYPNFSIRGDEEALAVDPFPASPNRLLGNNLLDYSSSRWSSSYCSSPSTTSWPSSAPWSSSSSSSRDIWSTWSSSEETKPFMVGAGLANLGNTCFINAVLQCFTHTVPLVQALRSYDHTMPCVCGSEGFCALCSLRAHVERSLASSGGILTPLELVENLNYVSSCFRRYQQEDAHEFLQCFLDKLERCCLDLKGKDLSSQGNNLVEKVFGGRLVSKLRCCNCGHSSDTYEPLIDLSLEIEDVDTLPSALESFTKVERIEDSGAKFMCENCKEEVLVEKQFMLEQAPSVAAFHLKRFKTDGPFVEKVDKHVEFPLELDLQPYSTGSQNNSVELKYNLYAIIVHIGFSSTSGHYFCFIRSSPETWYCLDDSKVTSVQEEFVLSQEAYILFYARQGTPWFSSIIDAHKPCLDPNILNTSPKSVLDSAEGASTSYPSVACIDNCDTSVSCKKGDEGVEINGARDAATGNTVQLLNQDELGSKDSKDDRLMDNSSTPLGDSKFCDVTSYNEKMSTTSTVGVSNSKIDEIKDDGFHPLTPPGSPSPDKVSFESSEVRYQIPRNHLKLEKRVSGKKQLNKDRELEDSKSKEALRYLSKCAHSSERRKKFIAAITENQSEGSLNKRKRMLSAPCKNSPPRARRRPNHNAIVQPMATAISR
ncbi:hypothetical protein F2P56_037125 [Juglans regia]|uniref:Ubiquitin carboxyl-terminal hydrolase n=2 Tax=Juglans regia TaxID=51240 RepID=A0A6P9EFJ7_JUGRE|nr:ubiquitin carboxyl-terminal hydrolase 20-like [Juglans regia]KAF5441925.1 hypothetical protein F2P56_037125 [Juglans regia]